MNTQRPLENRKLTENFWLYEFIEAHPTKWSHFIEHNWRHYQEFVDNYRYQELAEFLQAWRATINNKWKAANNGVEIGIRLTSAFRNSEWEDARGRKGEHRRSAVDARPTNVSIELGAEILEWCHNELEDHDGGLAIKHPTFDSEGKMVLMGFIHIDFGKKRRWTYP